MVDRHIVTDDHFSQAGFSCFVVEDGTAVTGGAGIIVAVILGIIGIMNNAAAYASGTGCKASGSILCGYAGNTGLVVGLYDNTAASSVGSSESPVTVRSSTINGNPVDSSNFGSKLAGSDAGITASGVASGLNTIWAVFQ